MGMEAVGACAANEPGDDAGPGALSACKIPCCIVCTCRYVINGMEGACMCMSARVKRLCCNSKQQRHTPDMRTAASADVYCRLHNAGIQVILDVVYNHTAELDDKHPYLISMR